MSSRFFVFICKRSWIASFGVSFVNMSMIRSSRRGSIYSPNGSWGVSLSSSPSDSITVGSCCLSKAVSCDGISSFNSGSVFGSGGTVGSSCSFPSGYSFPIVPVRSKYRWLRLVSVFSVGVCPLDRPMLVLDLLPSVRCSFLKFLLSANDVSDISKCLVRFR